MKLCMSKIMVNNEELKLNLDNETHERSVQYQGRDFTTLDELTTHFQELQSTQNATALAAAANFLFSGLEFILIEDPAIFRKRYSDRIKFEQTKSQAVRPEDSVLSSGGFNVDDIANPKVENGRLIYYVEDRNRGIPYKATCPMPFHNEKDYYQYEKLHFE